MNCGHDVCVAIHKLKEILETPKETFATAQNGLGDFVVILL